MAAALQPGWRAAAGIAAVAVLAGGLWLDRRIAAADAHGRELAARARQWEAPARAAAGLRQQVDAISRRGNALDALLQGRGRPAQLLDALARRVPPGVYLRSVSQRDDTVTLDGVARNHERVAALLRELEPVPWLAQVGLIESRADASVPGAPGDAPGLAFSVRLVYRAFGASAPTPPPRLERTGTHDTR